MATEKVETDAQGARRLQRASYIVSSLGIVVAIIIVAICIGVFAACRYHNGVCYRHFSRGMGQQECLEMGGDWYYGCYYDKIHG